VSAEARIDGLSERVDAAMRALIDARTMPLYRMMAYHHGWEDRQENPSGRRPKTRLSLRGAACLAACEAAGGEIEAGLPAAVAVELIESSFQVHDDVQSGSPQRDGRDSVWWTWGPAQAINAGDGLYALARMAVLQMRDSGAGPAATFEALGVLDAASLEVCEGRFEDMDAQERINLSVDAWLGMADKKTGALFGCAMRLGAMAAAADASDAEALAECGRAFGIAFQLRAEMRQVWDSEGGEETPAPDVLNKKKLIPIVYTFEKANISTKRRLGDIYFKRVLEQQDVPAVLAILEEMGAREYCESLVERNVSAAMDAVSRLPPEGAPAVGEFVEAALARA
jgi:geranylgeranyl diphosphate synthase type I